MSPPDFELQLTKGSEALVGLQFIQCDAMPLR